jgi:hypothetical protein
MTPTEQHRMASAPLIDGASIEPREIATLKWRSIGPPDLVTSRLDEEIAYD